MPGGTTVEFGLNSAQAQALRDTIDEGAKELKDNPDRFKSYIHDQIGKVVTPTQMKQPDRKPFDGKSILWVDDKPSNNRYESNLFRRLGAKITTSKNTLDALEKLKNNEFDLILSDIHRDEGGASKRYAGYELLEEINKRQLHIPLIFFISNVRKINKLRSQSAFGAADTSNELS